MTQQDIVDALNGRLEQFPGLGDVSWEGEAYEPQNGRPYLRAELSSYVETGVGAGIQGAAQFDGTYKVTVRRPADEGRRPAGQVAAALKQHFGRGAVVNAADGTPIILLQASEGVATYYGNWVSLPVTVTFTALS